MLSSAVQSQKAPRTILVTDSEISTCFKALQSQHVSFSMVVTEMGILMLSNALQSRNAPGPIHGHRLRDLNMLQGATIAKRILLNGGH